MNSIDTNLDYQSMADCTDLKHIPGDNGLPIIGKTIPLVMDTVGLVMSHVEKYGHISRIQIGPHKSLLITHPDDIREILIDSNRRYSSKMGYLPIIGHFYEGAILALDWEEHKINRRVFQTSFKNDAMKGYVELNNPIISQHLESWETMPDFRFYPRIKKLLLETAAKVVGVLEDERSEVVSAGVGAGWCAATFSAKRAFS